MDTLHALGTIFVVFVLISIAIFVVFVVAVLVAGFREAARRSRHERREDLKGRDRKAEISHLEDLFREAQSEPKKKGEKG